MLLEDTIIELTGRLKDMQVLHPDTGRYVTRHIYFKLGRAHILLRKNYYRVTKLQLPGVYLLGEKLTELEVSEEVY